MFNCSYPIISFKLFKEYYWFDFYRDPKEYIPPNTTKARVQEVSIYMLFNSDLVGDNPTRISQTMVFVFMNKAPIHWYRNIQATVELINFGS